MRNWIEEKRYYGWEDDFLAEMATEVGIYVLTCSDCGGDRWEAASPIVSDITYGAVAVPRTCDICGSEVKMERDGRSGWRVQLWTDAATLPRVTRRRFLTGDTLPAGTYRGRSAWTQPH